MATYKQVLKKYQSQMNELGLGEQSALLKEDERLKILGEQNGNL